MVQQARTTALRGAVVSRLLAPHQRSGLLAGHVPVEPPAFAQIISSNRPVEATIYRSGITALLAVVTLFA